MRLILSALLLVGSVATAQDIRTPLVTSVLGHEPGAEKTLPDWPKVRAVMAAIAKKWPDRVVIEDLGKTTEDRPLLMAVITSPANHKVLESLRVANRRLVDPRGLGDEEAADLLARARAIVNLNFTIHSNEVGGTQAAMALSEILARADSPQTAAILDNVITLIVPAHNPDGYESVVAWYRKNLGTPHERAAMPWLYHRYVGHDNNRDWFLFTQVETRLTVERIYNRWNPHVVVDVHQMGAQGPRLFVPPYMDPYEPNIDPRLVEFGRTLGHAVVAEMGRRGFAGVVSETIFDAWTPARAYQPYHGGFRFLTECASCDYATSVEVGRRRAGRGATSGNGGGTAENAAPGATAPFPGGTWTLRDIVRYDVASELAVLGQAARNRAAWVSNVLAIGRSAIDPGIRPFGFAIPMDPPKAAHCRYLIETLRFAEVEVRRAQKPFAAGGTTYPEGTAVVLSSQPFGAFARALLEPRRYPEIRTPAGELRRPYDATAHCLPQLFDIRVDVLADPFEADLSGPDFDFGPSGFSPGQEPPDRGRFARVGLYRGFTASMDEGWTRWLLERHRIPYVTVTDADMRRGRLGTALDVLVLPSQSAATILNGNARGTMPAEYCGGIGTEGQKHLVSFVEGGGRLVALERSTELAVRAFNLDATDVTEGKSRTALNVPGSILRAEIAAGTAITRGYTGSLPVFFNRSPAFDCREGTVLVRLAPKDLLLSGWIEGEPIIAGKALVAEFRRKKGQIVLFGIPPQFRAQTVGTFDLFFNALRAD